MHDRVLPDAIDRLRRAARDRSCSRRGSSAALAERDEGDLVALRPAGSAHDSASMKRRQRVADRRWIIRLGGLAVVDEMAISIGSVAGTTCSTSRATLSSRTMKSAGPEAGTGTPALSSTLTYIERSLRLSASSA